MKQDAGDDDENTTKIRSAAGQEIGVFVRKMMTGGHVRLLEAVPAIIQNIDVDAVVDQERRSRVDHRKRSRQRSVLMADLDSLSACCAASQG